MLCFLAAYDTRRSKEHCFDFVFSETTYRPVTPRVVLRGVEN
jgi:hypothetical protein